jgi:protein O-mannosyl-transferase
MARPPAPPPRPPALSALAEQRCWWLAGALALVGLIAYLPMLRNGFVWDDDTFLTQNPLIKAPDGLARFWFSTQPSDYWPVTSTTLWVEWRLWGMHAVGYHATNLILHVVEGMMLWSILRRLKVPGAYLAALLFVVHPVNVESVAWIAQRKNLMAMLFYLLSIQCFLRTDLVSPVAIPGTRKWYWLSLLAFTLAMLSKGSVAPLPVVFLGIVAWRRRVTPRDGVRLAPFFVVAAALIGVNVWFQTHGWTGIIRHADALQRLLGAGGTVWFYLSKALLPVGLVFVYPQWDISAANLLWWLPLLGAVGFTLLLWRLSQTPAGRACLFAWLYFLVMLLPVMGFTDVYFMRYSLVADHYQHLAIIGVLALAAAGWAQWSAEPRLKIAIATVVVAILAGLTWRQCGMYLNTPTLYRVTLERNPDCWMVYNNQGLLEAAAGQPEQARRDFDRALQLNPHFAEANVNVGNSELAQGRPQEAIARYQQALQDRPDYADGYYSIGKALQSLGRNAEAITAYERALHFRADYPDAENNLGVALADLGQFSDAVAHYQRAIQWNPGYATAYFNYGNALRSSGQMEAAIREYEEALRLQPDYPDAENNLIVTLESSHRLPEALARCEAAVQLRPGDFAAHRSFGIALAMAGKLPEAEEQFQAALQIKPDAPDAQQFLARVRAMRQSPGR